MSLRKMTKQMWLALGSLLGCGALVGLSTNLAKVAFLQGLAPLPFLTWSLAGATLLLSAISVFKKQRSPKNKGAIKYYFIAGFFFSGGI